MVVSRDFTITRLLQHTERRPSHNHLLHDDCETVHITMVSAIQTRVGPSQYLRGGPQQVYWG